MRYSNTSYKETANKLSLNTKKPRSFVSQLVLVLIISIISALCFLSIVLVVIGAFSSEASINANGFSFFPKQWSVDAFSYVGTFKGQLVQSYIVTLFETVAGTIIALFFTCMFSYVLSRKSFMLNKFFSIYILITMLFSGGLLGSYLINTNVFHLRNNLLVLIIPGCVTAWNTIVMRSFIVSNVPDALVEAAKIDGAGEIYTFYKIVLPLLTPVIAALGFMIAVAHWNEWQTAFLYIDNPNFATLQLMLIRIEKNLSFLQERMSYLSPEEIQMMKNAPSESSRMAILLVTIGPIMFVFPFFQKYFIKGITMGAVKG